MERKIDLISFFKIIKKHLKLLILLPLVFLVIALGVTFYFMKPQYEASTQVIVNQKETNDENRAQQIQSDLQLVNTYSEIIKSPNVLDKVSKKIGGKYSSKQLSKMITVNNKAQSQILNISVVSPSKMVSQKIANETTNVFKSSIKDILNVDNVTVLSKADESTQVSPKPLINGIAAIILGLIIAALIIFIREILDKRIKNEEDVNKELKLPVLGTITKF